MYTDQFLKDKLITTDQLVKLINPGNRIFLSSGPAIPGKSVGKLLSGRDVENYDLEFFQLFNLGHYFNEDRCEWTTYRLITFRTGESVAEEACQGRFDFIPANLMEIPYIFATGQVDIDVAIVTTSPPDKRGYMSMGIANDVAHIAIRQADIVIAEVNENMPVTYGDTSIHVDQVDYVIESDTPLLERERKQYDAELDRMAYIEPDIRRFNCRSSRWSDFRRCCSPSEKEKEPWYSHKCGI